MWTEIKRINLPKDGQKIAWVTIADPFTQKSGIYIESEEMFFVPDPDNPNLSMDFDFDIAVLKWRPLKS